MGKNWKKKTSVQIVNDESAHLQERISKRLCTPFGGERVDTGVLCAALDPVLELAL